MFSSSAPILRGGAADATPPYGLRISHACCAFAFRAIPIGQNLWDTCARQSMRQTSTASRCAHTGVVLRQKKAVASDEATALF